MVIFHSYVKLPEGTPLSVTSGGAKKLSADALNGSRFAGHPGCLQRPGWGLPEYGAADSG